MACRSSSAGCETRRMSLVFNVEDLVVCLLEFLYLEPFTTNTRTFCFNHIILYQITNSKEILGKRREDSARTYAI